MKSGLLILSLFLSACASLTNLNGGDTVKLPEVTSAKKSKDYYITQAAKNKIRIGSRLKQNFDFFYGPNGSYFIVVSSQENRINLSDYDVTLKINSKDKGNPEQLAMAQEDEQVASGFGDFREGSTDFEVLLTPISAEFHPAFKFNFNVILNPSL
jgi:hypothetical protein